MYGEPPLNSIENGALAICKAIDMTYIFTKFRNNSFSQGVADRQTLGQVDIKSIQTRFYFVQKF